MTKRVYDCIHIVVDAVVYHFLDSCQVRIAYRAVKAVHICCAGLSGHIPPGDRDTDGVKASLLDFFDHVLCGNHIAPGGLDLAGCQRAVPGVGGIQGVAQVPAQTHILDQFHSGLVCCGCNRSTQRQCGGHGQPDCCSRHGAEQFLHKLHVIELLRFSCGAADSPLLPLRHHLIHLILPPFVQAVKRFSPITGVVLVQTVKMHKSCFIELYRMFMCRRALSYKKSPRKPENRLSG